MSGRSGEIPFLGWKGIPPLHPPSHPEDFGRNGKSAILPLRSLNFVIDLSFLVLGVYYFLRILSWLIIVRIILSWVAPTSHHPLALFVVQTSEQVIGPIRRMLPRGSGAMAMIDWSPLVALIAIDVLRYFLVRFFA